MSVIVNEGGHARLADARTEIPLRPPPDEKPRGVNRKLQPELNPPEANSLDKRGEAAAVGPPDKQSLDWAAERFKQIDWELVHAKALHFLWIGPVKAIFAVIYIAIVRDGFVNLTPTFAMRLSQIPGLRFLADSDAFYAVDIALVLSAFLFIVVSYCWAALFRLWTSGDRSAFATDEQKYANRYESLIVGLSMIVIFAELTLFYQAIVESTWGGSAFSFTALLASLVFVGVLLGVILIGIHLELTVKQLEESK